MKKRVLNSLKKKKKKKLQPAEQSLEVNFQTDPLCHFKNLFLGKCIVFTVWKHKEYTIQNFC